MTLTGGALDLRTHAPNETATATPMVSGDKPVGQTALPVDGASTG